MANPLSDAHVHLGGCTPLATIRAHAGEEAFRAASDAVAALQGGATLAEFLAAWFPALERLQGDPAFLEHSAYGAALDFACGAAGARSFELRFCPFLRPCDPEAQVDAVLRGLRRAVDGGVLDHASLAVIAMRGNREHLARLPGLFGSGIAGVDVAGDENGAEDDPGWMRRVRRAWEQARAAGLFTTYHSGEGDRRHTEAVVAGLPLTRIGHGVALRGHVREGSWPVFELCPAVNAATRVASFQEVLDFARELHAHGHRFVFGSDNPVAAGTSFAQQWQRIPDDLRVLASETALAIRHRPRHQAAPAD